MSKVSSSSFHSSLRISPTTYTFITHSSLCIIYKPSRFKLFPAYFLSQSAAIRPHFNISRMHHGLLFLPSSLISLRHLSPMSSKKTAQSFKVEIAFPRTAQSVGVLGSTPITSWFWAGRCGAFASEADRVKLSSRACDPPIAAQRSNTIYLRR